MWLAAPNNEVPHLGIDLPRAQVPGERSDPGTAREPQALCGQGRRSTENYLWFCPAGEKPAGGDTVWVRPPPALQELTMRRTFKYAVCLNSL